MCAKWVLSSVVCGLLFGSITVSAEGGQRPAVASLAPKIRLGKKLFFDRGLSEPAGQSCASCHEAKAGHTDGSARRPTSKGVIPGRFGNRNSPTAAYAAFSPVFHFDDVEGLFVGGQFVDGRAATLQEQAKAPFLNPLEMANPDKAHVVDKVRVATYADLFRIVFGQQSLDDVDTAYEHIADAIAAFETTRSFNRFSSKYDAYLAGKVELTDAEARGLALFEDETKGNCAACHPSQPAEDGTPPLFTDFTYDNLGVPKNPRNPFYKLPSELNPDGRKFVDKGLGAIVGLGEEMGKFKVPTLRNIAITGPFMHNGYFETLEGVVRFYNDRDVQPRCQRVWVTEKQALEQGCWPGAEVAENVNVDELGDLGLTDQEISDIVAFLGTLTDGYRPDAP
jgi:cytochrome c peroxidase